MIVVKICSEVLFYEKMCFMWRKISNTRYTYGLGCLKKMCNSVNVHNVKNLKGETLLNRKILKLCNKKTLPIAQRQLLTDRYLTLNLLNEVPLDCYNNYRNLLQSDIDTINRTTTLMNLHSCDVITLKQASEINKKYKAFQKIMNGEYDVLQNFSFDVVRFAFSNYYNDKPYLSDMTQSLQFCILKGGEYIKDDDFWKAFIGSTANNLAMIGTACNVVNEYNITVKFKLENWEV